MALYTIEKPIPPRKLNIWHSTIPCRAVSSKPYLESSESTKKSVLEFPMATIVIARNTLSRPVKTWKSWRRSTMRIDTRSSSTIEQIMLNTMNN